MKFFTSLFAMIIALVAVLSATATVHAEELAAPAAATTGKNEFCMQNPLNTVCRAQTEASSEGTNPYDAGDINATRKRAVAQLNDDIVIESCVTAYGHEACYVLVDEAFPERSEETATVAYGGTMVTYTVTITSGGRLLRRPDATRPVARTE